MQDNINDKKTQDVADDSLSEDIKQADDIVLDLDGDIDQNMNNDIGFDNDKIDNDDVDNIISQDEENNATDTIKKLKKEIKEISKEKQDTLTAWQKDKAEFINARKRDIESREEAIRFSNSVLINELLPIIDNYEQAKNQVSWNNVDENWRKGIESILDSLSKLLNKYGVNSFGNIHEKFDTKLHEALGVDITDDDKLDSCISVVMQKGYKLHDKVLRPALVRIFEK